MDRLSSVEAYNPKTGRWSELPEMINARSNFSVAIIDEVLVVMGGYNGSTTCVDVECYIPSRNSW